MRWVHRRHRRALVLTALASTAAGLVNATLISLINRAFRGAEVGPAELLGLTALAAALVGTSGHVARRVTISIIEHETMKLAEDLLMAPIERLERVRASQVTSALASDIQLLGGHLQLVAQLGATTVTAVGALAYVAVTTPSLLLVAGFAILLGGILVVVLSRFLTKLAAARRSLIQAQLEALTGLLLAGKELRLNTPRARSLVYGQLGPLTSKLGALDRRGSLAGALLGAVERTIVFALLALAAWLGPSTLGLSGVEAASFGMTMLFVLTLLGQILLMAPTLGDAGVAAGKLSQLREQLGPSPDEVAVRDADAAVAWNDLTMDEISHDRQGEGFVLGPVDLHLRRGTITFIVGGNGSGKTTLLKVLCGLYRPTRGELTLGDTPITDGNRAWYRQHFASVFFDFHLATDDLPFTPPELRESATRYLEQLQLTGLVDLEERKTTRAGLSTGQRRRVALLFAYLENRPILVFDEWAADQDPGFKAFFYRRLLPDLRAMGRTVIAVTHDDRYFDVADQLIKLESGRLTGDATSVFMARLGDPGAIAAGR